MGPDIAMENVRAGGLAYIFRLCVIRSGEKGVGKRALYSIS